MEARGRRLPPDQIGGNSIAALAREFEAPLRRFFSRRIKDQADVPDLLQEVFLRLSSMADASRIDHRDRFIFVVANNVLRDRFRRQTVRGWSRAGWRSISAKASRSQ